MKWITALNLENWAQTLPSRTQFSELIGNLIRASVEKITDYRFPTGDSAQLTGYDGRLITAEAFLPYVPAGESVWEFGTDEDVLQKVNKDYSTRTQNPGSVDPAKNTFVLVTARRWTGKKVSLEEWCSQKKDEKIWKDVRIIDAVGLEDWFERSPAVAARAARELLAVVPQLGAQSTLEFWQEYSARFEIPLTEDVLLCGRKRQADDLLRELNNVPQVLFKQADSADEAIAFVVAAIRKAEQGVAEFFDTRVLIVDSKEAARLLGVRKNMILLPRGEALDIAPMLAKNNTCVIGIGRELQRSNVAKLERPSTHDLTDALKTMGLPEQRAYKLARSCGRSATILSRLMPSVTAPEPVWAKDKKLIPALLAGSWTLANAEDRHTLQVLSGDATYDAYEDNIRGLLTIQDAPLEREGQVWNVRAPVDAFTWLGPIIGKQDMTRLEQVCKTVFSEYDPALELAPQERPYAELSGKKLTHSRWLRDGLATTLLLLAVFHKESRMTSLDNPRLFVENIIANLPGLKSDHRLLASLEGELPVLMEAAPRPLFEALEHLLEGEGDKIRPIFADVDPLFAHSPHTGLLWALELAAWDPENLPRAAIILARLAKVDPGGKLSNRPLNSLSELFVPWHPNTNATLAQRLLALDKVIEREPEIAWKLILGLLPGGHDISHPTMKPRYREAGASEREVLTQGLLWEGYREIIQRALALVGNNVQRWGALISKIDRFHDAAWAKALDLLVALVPNLADSDRKELWAKLRDLLNRHSAFQDALWAMKPDRIESLKGIAKQFEPADDLSKVAWLFSEYHPRLPDPETKADYTAVDKAREEAVRKLYQAGGVEKILSLAQTVKMPRFVAFAAGNVIEDLSCIEMLIDETLNKSEALDEFAIILSAHAINKFPAEWLNRVLLKSTAKEINDQNAAKLLLAWPDNPATWSFAAMLGPEMEKSYWENKQVRFLSDDKDVVETAVRKYLSVGRALAAIELIGWKREIVSSELMLETLDQAIDELNKLKGPSNMLQFEFERVFEALAARTDVPPIEIATREYKYLPILEMSLIDGRTQELTLHKLMAEDPAFFVMIICDVFKAASGEPREPTEDAHRRASLGYRLLDSFHVIPGIDEGNINTEELKNWVETVRRLAKEKDRAKIAEEFIGHLLAYAPSDSDGFWPHVAIRNLLEESKSDQLELGILIERSNMRGVVTKAMYEGGSQERTLAENARAQAKGTAKWPRTSALWRRFADGLEFDAKREDERAKQDEMWFE